MASSERSSLSLVFLFVFAGVEIFLFSGVIQGWAPLLYVFKEEGYLSSVCDEYNLIEELQPTFYAPAPSEYGGNPTRTKQDGIGGNDKGGGRGGGGGI